MPKQGQYLGDAINFNMVGVQSPILLCDTIGKLACQAVHKHKINRTSLSAALCIKKANAGPAQALLPIFHCRSQALVPLVVLRVQQVGSF